MPSAATLKAHGLLLAWLLLLTVAGLACYQDLTGRLLRKTFIVKPKQFKEQAGFAYRCVIPEVMDLPDRLRNAVAVLEDGWEMDRTIARVVQNEGGGGYAWTRKAFWLAPFAPNDPRSGSTRYEVIVPRTLTGWQRTLFYLPAIAMLAAAGTVASWRGRFTSSLAAWWDWLLN